MLIADTPLSYRIGVAVWLAVLAAVLVGLLRLLRGARRRRWLGFVAKAGLSLWMLLAALTALEVGFAAFYSESDALNFTNVGKRWHAIHIAPQLDQLGLRTRHSTAAMLAPGPQRIAFVGDSFTFGHGVPRREDRFSDRIEAALEAARPGRWAVDNLGVPGHDVTAVAAQVETLFAHGYRPALVVYVWQINDLEQLDERTAASLRDLTGGRDANWLIRETYFFNWLHYRLRLSGSVVSTYFDDLRAAYGGPAFARASAVLDRLRAACAAHGAELRLVVFPFLHALGDDYAFGTAHRRLAEYARAAGLRLLDLEPVLSAHAGERLIVNPRDTHPNERAHELAAAAIETALLDDLFAGGGGR